MLPFFDPAEPVVAFAFEAVRPVDASATRDALDRGAFFLALAADPWARFASGRKTVEVRRALARYGRIQPGCRVVLRRGYSGDDLLGRVTHRYAAPRLDALPSSVLAAACLRGVGTIPGPLRPVAVVGEEAASLDR